MDSTLVPTSAKSSQNWNLRLSRVLKGCVKLRDLLLDRIEIIEYSNGFYSDRNNLTEIPSNVRRGLEMATAQSSLSAVQPSVDVSNPGELRVEEYGTLISWLSWLTSITFGYGCVKILSHCVHAPLLVPDNQTSRGREILMPGKFEKAYLQFLFSLCSVFSFCTKMKFFSTY